MPAVVTFAPLDLRIIEISAGGDNELRIDEIYSEWKDWLLADPTRVGYPPAFRQVGSDPTSDTENLGTTFFLTGGWRIRPAESDHRLVLTGNMYTDPAGFSPVAPTLGGYTVPVEYQVSNLVDSVSARTAGGPKGLQLASAKQADGVRGIFTALTDNGILAAGVGAGDITVTVLAPDLSTAQVVAAAEVAASPGLYSFLVPAAFLTTHGVGAYTVIVSIASLAPKVNGVSDALVHVTGCDIDEVFTSTVNTLGMVIATK